jgi:DNA-binding NtrC family response regulator
MLNSSEVLIVTTDSLRCEKAEEIVRHLGLQFTTCGSLTEARASTIDNIFRFVLCSDDLPDCNLRTAVRVLTASTDGAPVIVLSHLADWEAYLRALAAGAFDYIACPPDVNEAERILRLALAHNPPPRASRSAVA